MPPQKPKAFEAEETKLHRIRITLTSRNVRNLEKGLSSSVVWYLLASLCRSRQSCQGEELESQGPSSHPYQGFEIDMPQNTLWWRYVLLHRILVIVIGSKTWDRFEMRIHKRVIDLQSPQEIVKQITSISIEPGVEVEIIMDVE